MARGRIPFYDQQTQVGALPGTPHVSADDGFANALASVGQTATGLAIEENRRQQEADRVLREAEDRRAIVEAHKQVASFEADSIIGAQDLEDQYQSQPFGHMERVAKQFDDGSSKLLGTIQNPRAAAYAEQAMATARARNVVQAAAWERGRIDKNRGEDVAKVGDTLGDVVASDVTRFADAEQQVRSLAEVSGMDPKDRRIEATLDGLALRAGLGMAERDPGAALALFDQRLGVKPTERAPSGLTPTQRAAWQTLPPGERDAFAKVQLATNADPTSQHRAVVDPGAALVQPPDTSVEGGEPGKTGVAWADRLSPEQVVQLRNKAEAAYKQDVGALQQSIRGRIADSEAAASIGRSLPVPSKAEFVAAFGDKGPEMYDLAARIPIAGARRGSMATLPFAELKALAERPITPGDVPGSTAADIREVEADQRHAAAILTSRQKDYIQAASDQGIAVVNPIDWRNTEAAMAELRSRQAVAQSSERFAPGASMGALKGSEAATFRQAWGSLDPNGRANVLRTLTDSLSDPNVRRATIQQIAPDSPPVRVAAAIMGKDDPTARPIAATILRGDDMLNPNKAGKAEDGKPSRFAMPPDFERVFDEAVGPALAGNPAARQEGLQAVRAWYAATMADRGLYGKDNADSDVVKEGIAATIGAVVPWTGAGSFVAPWGMPADVARNKVNAAWSAAVAANGFERTPVADARSTHLVVAEEGVYLVASGTGFVMGRDGKPITLDIRPAPWPRGLPGQVPK